MKHIHVSKQTDIILFSHTRTSILYYWHDTMSRLLLLSLLVVVLAAASQSFVHAFSFGPAATGYLDSEEIPVRVNALTSSVAIMPFPYYSMKTCKPLPSVIRDLRKKENIGELMWGDQIEPAVYDIRMLKNVSCKVLCEPESYTDAEANALRKLIEQQYRGNLILDNLPVAQLTRPAKSQPKVILGYPLGMPAQFAVNKQTTVNNHLIFKIKYHIPDTYFDLGLHNVAGADAEYRVVGFFAEAVSIKYTDVHKQCKPGSPPLEPASYPALQIDPKAPAGVIPWTYSVQWIEEPEVAWATRWDIYLSGAEQDNKIHWFSIVNSLLVVFVLSALVAMILIRTVKSDFVRFNETDPEAQDETGWKMVKHDVFRAPQNPVLLTALVSSGVQMGVMLFITIGVACLGFLSPSRRGAMLSTTIQLWALLGVVAGYIAGRMLKFFGEQSWKNVFAAATLVPGIVFALYFCLNLVQWYKHASNAVRFTTMLLLLLLWLGVALPLVLMGAATGFRSGEASVPGRVNDVERLIKEQPAHLHWLGAPFLAGAVPFVAAFIEMAFILSSFWQGRVYYVFGFMALVAIVVVLTVAETTIVLVYFTLVNEDYRWWWRSFASGAALGVHLFLYSLYYLRSHLPVRQPTSVIVYIGYMGTISFIVGVFAGAVALVCSFWFVRKIYGSIRSD